MADTRIRSYEIHLRDVRSSRKDKRRKSESSREKSLPWWIVGGGKDICEYENREMEDGHDVLEASKALSTSSRQQQSEGPARE
jgi:hypothetical protein